MVRTVSPNDPNVSNDSSRVYRIRSRESLLAEDTTSFTFEGYDGSNVAGQYPLLVGRQSHVEIHPDGANSSDYGIVMEGEDRRCLYELVAADRFTYDRSL